MKYDAERVPQIVAETLIDASSTFRPDQIKAYERAIEKEDNPKARWVMEKILENARIAQEIRKPLCDDTGTPHLFIEIGDGIEIDAKFFKLVEEGVKLGLRRLPGRPMAVKGNEIERLGQNKGLYKNPEAVRPSPFQIRTIRKKALFVTVMMLGGGPELRAKTFRVYHRRRGMNVIDEAARWAAEEVGGLGCTPTIPAIGIGRTHYEATCLVLEAMREGDLLKQSRLEKIVTTVINKEKVGPLGLGGKTTALGCFLKIGTLRAAGPRMVSMRLGCCFDPRRSTGEIPLKY